MLSLGKITSGGESYYLDAVADGIDEYYRGVGEAPGWWAGRAAGGLGLDGEVGSEQLKATWAGLDPRSGEKLGPFHGRKVAGLDLCFRAPKSVSVLAGLGDPNTAAVVLAAHDAAVAAAFAYVDENASRSRVGRNGVTQVGVKGLVAAGFRHRTSRAGDPHLHTHMLVANMAECDDGIWRTLDARVVFQYARTAGFLYEAHLRHELTARLGVEWMPVKKGISNVAGIDEEVLDHFSDRSKEIAGHLDEVGFRPARAREIATLETRRVKDHGRSEVAMREVWQRKADDIGFDPDALAQVIGRVPAREPAVDVEGILANLAGAQGLTRHAATFTRRDVLRGIAEAAPAGVAVGHAERIADSLLAGREVVRLAEGARGPGLIGSNSIRRSDGSIISAGIDEIRWSTVELVAIEARLTARAVERVAAGIGVVDDDALDQALDDRPTLSHEQVALLEVLTQAGDGVAVVSASAGTGKTYTLDAARDAWQFAGFEVVGAALSGVAARELEASAGIRSRTLAKLVADLDAGEAAFDDRTILVIDLCRVPDYAGSV